MGTFIAGIIMLAIAIIIFLSVEGAFITLLGIILLLTGIGAFIGGAIVLASR